ncbi:MAG: VOC family protein [Bacteriovorax sp.]|jgi:PhnB protein
MNTPTPYIFFNGNCREAMQYYRQCIDGGDVFVMTYGEARGEKTPPALKERALHASLRKDNFFLMASDTPDYAPTVGNNVHMYYSCRSREEVDHVFSKLSAGGIVKEALNDTFWGAYFGMLTDKYGFNWMIGFEKPRATATP